MGRLPEGKRPIFVVFVAKQIPRQTPLLPLEALQDDDPGPRVGAR